MKKSLFIVLTLTSLVSTSSYATGMYECEATDRADWKTEQQLTEKMESEGWTIRRIKEDGGCYEVYGKTPEGKRVEAYYHPVTMEKLLVSQRGSVIFEKK